MLRALPLLLALSLGVLAGCTGGTPEPDAEPSAQPEPEPEPDARPETAADGTLTLTVRDDANAVVCERTFESTPASFDDRMRVAAIYYGDPAGESLLFAAGNDDPDDDALTEVGSFSVLLEKPTDGTFDVPGADDHTWTEDEVGDWQGQVICANRDAEGELIEDETYYLTYSLDQNDQSLQSLDLDLSGFVQNPDADTAGWSPTSTLCNPDFHSSDTCQVIGGRVDADVSVTLRAVDVLDPGNAVYTVELSIDASGVNFTGSRAP